MSKRFDRFAKAFSAGVPRGAPAVAYPSLTGSSAAFAAATLAVDRGGVVLAVTAGLPEADTLFSDLEAVADEVGVRVLEFPPVIEDDNNSAAARLKVSAVLGAYAIRPYPLVIVSPVMALREGVVSSEKVSQAEIALSVGKTMPSSAPPPTFAHLQEKLLAAGYRRVAEVASPGEFSVRGGVLDAWSPDVDRPVRAEFFGDDLESLREFDVATQVSVRKIEEAHLAPVALGENAGKTATKTNTAERTNNGDREDCDFRPGADNATDPRSAFCGHGGRLRGGDAEQGEVPARDGVRRRRKVGYLQSGGSICCV